MTDSPNEPVDESRVAGYVQRAEKLARRVRSNDEVAMGRMEALLREMRHDLGEGAPETLEASLVYLELQYLEGHRGFGEDPADIYAPVMETFGPESLNASRVRFVGAFHAMHQAVEIIDDDDDDDDLSEELEEYVAEALREIGPAVEGIARARGADRIAGLLAMVTQSCLEELFAGDGEGASRFLDRIMQLDTGPRSLSWLYEPLSSVVDEVTSCLDDEETISVDAVCAVLVRYEDGQEEVPPREDLLDDHAASFVLARLVVAGFATPTDQGVDLLQEAWDALMEASQGLP